MTKLPVATKKTLPANDYWREFRTEMDNLFDRFFTGFDLPAWRGVSGFMPSWRLGFEDVSAPVVDFGEDAKAYTISAEFPGLDEKDVSVTVAGDTIVVEGEKKQETEEKTKSHYIAERSYGLFRRSFALPENVDREKIAASYAKGVLKVTLPKTAEAQKERKIEVKAA